MKTKEQKNVCKYTKNKLIQLKNKNGITLIALVVTIIVLIILAGVSISLVLGDNGIVTKSKEAKQNMQVAANEEQASLANLEVAMENEGGEGMGNPTPAIYTIIFKGTHVTSAGENTVNGNETYTTQLTVENGYKISTITIKMGEKILEENTDYTYENKVLTIPNINGNVEITVTCAEISISDLKAGEYIKYDTGVTSVGENGVITCRVLYEASSSCGLQIISDKNVSNVTLGVNHNFEATKEAYNSAIEMLNNNTIGAGKYLNTTYAVDARCVGSKPTVDASGNFTEKNNEIPGPVTIEFEYNGSNTIDCKNGDVNYTKDKTQMTNINIMKTGEYYWLASRLVELNSSECIFYINYVASDGYFNRQ